MTPTITRTPTITGTPTITRTPTATPRPGSDVSFFGLARPDYTLVEPDGVTGPDDLPYFERHAGDRFVIIIEGKRGPNRRPVGPSTLDSDPFNPNVRPGLEIIVSRALGNGSAAVCDDMPPTIGGVPASASFAATQAISNAINDFACRFVDGEGLKMGRGGESDSCIKSPDGLSHFADSESSMQFCAAIAEDFAFPTGDTTVTVRLNDVDGRPGPPVSFVIRVRP